MHPMCQKVRFHKATNDEFMNSFYKIIGCLYIESQLYLEIKFIKTNVKLSAGKKA